MSQLAALALAPARLPPRLRLFFARAVCGCDRTGTKTTKYEQSFQTSICILLYSTLTHPPGLKGGGDPILEREVTLGGDSPMFQLFYCAIQSLPNQHSSSLSCSRWGNRFFAPAFFIRTPSRVQAASRGLSTVRAGVHIPKIDPALT